MDAGLADALGLDASWRRAFAEVERLVGGRIVGAERQARGRPAWDLDVETERQIIDVFRQMVHGGTAVVLVTHNRNLISYADRAFEMQNGLLHDLPVSEETS